MNLVHEILLSGGEGPSDHREIQLLRFVAGLTLRIEELVSDIQPLIDKEHKDMTKGLSDSECKNLSLLIEKLYEKLI